MPTYSDTKINKAARLGLLLSIPGDTMLHHSGRRYYIMQVANNCNDLEDPRFPPTLVYKQVTNGGLFPDSEQVFARPVKDLMGKMINISLTETRINEALELDTLEDY